MLSDGCTQRLCSQRWGVVEYGTVCVVELSRSTVDGRRCTAARFTSTQRDHVVSDGFHRGDVTDDVHDLKTVYRRAATGCKMLSCHAPSRPNHTAAKSTPRGRAFSALDRRTISSRLECTVRDVDRAEIPPSPPVTGVAGGDYSKTDAIKFEGLVCSPHGCAGRQERNLTSCPLIMCACRRMVSS